MADPSDGSFNLKHRLVGATVLILVAVILLPRVLTGADGISVRSNVNESPVAFQIQPQISSGITSSDSGMLEISAETKIEILDQPGVNRTEEPVGNAEVNDVPESNATKDRVGEISSSSRLSASESIVTGWIARVGTFQRAENAKKVIAKLQNDGIHAKTETIEIDDQQATRIWLGPFSTRSEAVREGNKAMMRTNSKPIVKEWP